MKIRLAHYIIGLLVCITIYTFISTSWSERISYLFRQYEITTKKILPEELVYQKKYILEKIEQHLALGELLQKQVASIQKKELKKGGLKKEEAPVDVSTIAYLYQYRLWQLQAQAMLVALDEKLRARFQEKNALSSVEMVRSIVSLAKKQLTESDFVLDLGRTKKLQSEAGYAIEKQFTLFFASNLKNIIEEQKNKLTEKNSQQVLLEIGVWFEKNEQLDSYIPLIREGNISLFDALQVFLTEKEYTLLTKSVAFFIEKLGMIVKGCNNFSTCLSQISVINKYVDAIAIASTSSFEITGNNFTTITKALTLYRNNLASVVLQGLMQGTQLKDGITQYYAMLLPLTSSLTIEQKKEHAATLRAGFFSYLRSFLAICEQKDLFERFSQAISIFSNQESISLLAADGLPAKELAPMRVLFLALHARLNQCGGDDKTSLKEMLKRLQTLLYAEPKKQQEEMIKKDLDNLLITQVSSLSDKILAPYKSAIKQFITLFLADSYDVHDFLQSIEKKTVFRQQLDAIIQNQKEQAVVKKKLFIAYVQEFSQFIKEKYKFLQQLHDTIEKAITPEKKDKSMLLIKEWIVKEPLLYEQLRKMVRSVVLSGDESRKITLINDLKEQFSSLIPTLVATLK